MSEHISEDDVIAIDDDEIHQETCIPIADADPTVIARRMRRLGWDERAVFFSNIFLGSIQMFAYFSEANRKRRGSIHALSALVLHLMREIDQADAREAAGQKSKW